MQVAQARGVEERAMERVGPAGGVWGGARHASELRQPLGVKLVVSAAVATGPAACHPPEDAASVGAEAAARDMWQAAPPGSAGSSKRGGLRLPKGILV